MNDNFVKFIHFMVNSYNQSTHKPEIHTNWHQTCNWLSSFLMTSKKQYLGIFTDSLVHWFIFLRFSWLSISHLIFSVLFMMKVSNWLQSFGIILWKPVVGCWEAGFIYLMSFSPLDCGTCSFSVIGPPNIFDNSLSQWQK